jgi:hypothetical protein
MTYSLIIKLAILLAIAAAIFSIFISKRIKDRDKS